MTNIRQSRIDRSLKAFPVWRIENCTEYSSSTEQKSNYVPHTLSSFPSFNPKSTYVKPNTPFEHYTEYRDNYLHNKRNLSQKFVRRLDQIQLSKLPMESQSNYGYEFKQKNPEKTTPVNPPVSTLKFNYDRKVNDGESGSSVYKKDFQEWNKIFTLNTASTLKEDVINNEGAPTDYQENFNWKPPSKLYLPYPSYRKPEIPFAKNTIYNDTFIKYEYCKEPIKEPIKCNISIESKPLDTQTTYQFDFTKKEREVGINSMNSLQDISSLMQIVPTGDWYDKCPSQNFNSRNDGIFYKS